MGTYKTKLIILSRRNINEADRLLYVFSLQKGKHTIIAKGARKSLAHLGGKIELYYCLFAQLAEGKTFDILTDAQILSTPSIEINKIDNIKKAYSISKLIDKLFINDHPQARIFFLLSNVFSDFNSKSRIILLAGLINELGFKPNPHTCPICRQKLNLPLSWSEIDGFVHQECVHTLREISDSQAKAIKLFLVEDFSFTNKINLDQNEIFDIELALEEYLIYHTGINIKN